MNQDKPKKIKKTNKKITLKKIKKTRQEFKQEFNKQLLTAITASFAFLIALTWREPISETLNIILEPLGERETILIKFIGAIIITLLAALILLIITKKLKREEQK